MKSFYLYFCTIEIYVEKRNPEKSSKSVLLQQKLIKGVVKWVSEGPTVPCRGIIADPYTFGEKLRSSRGNLKRKCKFVPLFLLPLF